jgi:hypothetical protein
MDMQRKPVTEGRSYTLLERLEAIARFLPVFETHGFCFGEWTPIREVEGVMQLPYFTMSHDAHEFVQAAYEYGWVLAIDWGIWKETPEAVRLRDDPQFLASATSEQLENLLTVCIRQDRFCEGALESAFESRLLAGILQRAEAVRYQLANGAQP